MTRSLPVKTVAIVGAGPGGATLAVRLRRLGYRVALVEKASFPREHIGESLTGECAIVLSDMGFGDAMDAAGFPVKRAVTVHGPNKLNRFRVPVQRLGEDGVIIPGQTWQVRRPEFDSLLLNGALAEGAELIRAEARGVLRRDGRISGLRLRDETGKDSDLTADFVADASGLQTFLSRSGVCGARHRGGYEKQVAFYGQFEGARRDAAPDDGATHIFYAARHLWAWFIPISSTVTSIGVVTPGALFKESGQSVQEYLTAQLASLHPELTERLCEAQPVSETWSTSNYSYHIDDFAGDGYLCIGDAHQFTDPIFSFGVSNSVQEASLAADAIDGYLTAPSVDRMHPIHTYADIVSRAQARVKTLIDTFWEFPLAFLKLAHYDRQADIAELLSGRLYSQSAEMNEAGIIMRDLLAKRRVAGDGRA